MARDHFLKNGQAEPGRCPICMMDDQGIFTEEAAEVHEVFAGACPVCSASLARAIDNRVDTGAPMLRTVGWEFPTARAPRAFEFLHAYYLPDPDPED